MIDDNVISGIYCIENKVNSKKYIGYSKNIKRRTIEHFNLLRRGKHENPVLQYAFDKYKEENFLTKILEECEEKEFNDKEIFYIEKMKSHVSENGYNIAKGGNTPPSPLGKKMSEVTKQKLREINTGRKMPEEAVEKNRKNVLKRWENDEYRQRMRDVHTGKITSDETKKKMSKAQTGRKVLDTTKHKINGKKQSIIKQGKRNENKKYSSIYIGVCEKKGRWQASITYKGKTVYIGTFLIEIDAAKAYDKKALELFGENAHLNFPKEN